MNTNSKGQFLDVLQIFRGIAALMVVIHHSITSLKYYHNIDNHFLDFIGSMGKFGVDFFFMLSGFIIAYTSYFKYNEPNSFTNYIKNRLIRIYIPYLPVGVFMLLLYTVLPSFSNSERDISVLTSLTLIPFGHPALSVAWTLSFELCFYLLFSISFFSKKGWKYFLFFWMLSVVVFNYTELSNLQLVKNPFCAILFSTYNIEFVLGYLIAQLITKKIKFRLFYLVLSFVISSSFFLYCHYFKIILFKSSINLLFSLVTFLVIYTAIVYFNKRMKKNALFMLIGNATYSIYLIHNPLQMILIRFYPKINSLLSIFIVLVLSMSLSSFIGYIYYSIFEKKIMNIVKSKVLK